MIAKKTDVPFHAAACIFPLMEGDDFEQLVADIRQNGLREPIALLDEQVIDGRNRYRACLLAGVKHRFVEIKTDDPVAFVLSLNLHRRHLTPTQAAMCAARARECYDQQANERQRGGQGGKLLMENLPQANGSARDAAGKAFGVSGKSVDNATRVLNSGNVELIEAVDKDHIAVSTAARLSSRAPEEISKTLDNAKNGCRRPRSVDNEPPVEDSAPGKVRGVGVMRANEAIDALKRIPKNDGLRKRGFQIVNDWIKANK